MAEPLLKKIENVKCQHVYHLLSFECLNAKFGNVFTIIKSCKMLSKRLK